MGSFKIEDGANLGFTQAEIDALTPLEGDVVYNKDTNSLQTYNGTAWVGEFKLPVTTDTSINNGSNLLKFVHDFTGNYTGEYGADDTQVFRFVFNNNGLFDDDTYDQVTSAGYTLASYNFGNDRASNVTFRPNGTWIFNGGNYGLNDVQNFVESLFNIMQIGHYDTTANKASRIELTNGSCKIIVGNRNGTTDTINVGIDQNSRHINITSTITGFEGVKVPSNTNFQSNSLITKEYSEQNSITPKFTTAQRAALTPQEGQTVIDSDLGYVVYYVGGQWINASGAPI